MKLIEHRTNLSKNENAYTYDVYNKTERLIKSLIPHLKKAGYAHISFSKHREFLKEIIFSLFEAQDFTPFFHVEGTHGKRPDGAVNVRIPCGVQAPVRENMNDIVMRHTIKKIK